MSLQLNTTQRALLQEMGIWWPPAPTPVPAAEQPFRGVAKNAAGEARERVPRAQGASVPPTGSGAPRPERAAPLPVPPTAAPATAPSNTRPARAALPPDFTVQGWAQWVQSVSECQACALHATRGQGVLRADEVPQQADWLVVLDPAQATDDVQCSPVVGDSARLLDAMLRAVGVGRGGAGAAGAYVTTVLKCRPPLAHAVQPEELAHCLQHLHAEIARVRPKVLLLMGRFAALLVPQAPHTPLEQLRSQVHTLQNVPTVVTYPPRALLRNPAFKGRAWRDLCLAADLAQGV